MLQNTTEIQSAATEMADPVTQLVQAGLNPRAVTINSHVCRLHFKHGELHGLPDIPTRYALVTGAVVVYASEQQVVERGGSLARGQRKHVFVLYVVK